MKKYLLAGFGVGLGVTVAAVVYAQVVIKVDMVCDKLDTVLALIHGKYQETPVIMAQSQDTNVVFMGNSKTGSWTVVQFNQEMACIVSSGEKFRLVNGTRI